MPELLPPDVLSEELRTADTPDMRSRRIAIGLSLAGAAIGGIVSLYQTGIVRRLPDILPGKVFDAEKVDASNYAYQNLQMPDGPQMVVNFALTAAIVATGGKDRVTQNPALPIAAAAKAIADLGITAALARSEWRENHKLCSWCQVATVLTIATVALTVPEAVRATRGAMATA